MLLVKIMIGVIAFVIIYDKSTRKYLNPYKTILYMGKKGCGKTTLLTKIAINNVKKGRVVYSTEMIPGTRLFDPLKIETYTMEPNSVVLFDEISMFFDNRDYKNFKKEYTTWFRYARQYKIEIHMFSQVADVDLKIRNLCDGYYLVENIGRVFSVAKRVSKVLTVGHDYEGTGKIVDAFEIIPFFMPSSRIITFIPRWSEFYNSYNPPKRQYMPHTQMYMTETQVKSMNNHWLFIIKKLLNELRSKVVAIIKRSGMFAKNLGCNE